VPCSEPPCLAPRGHPCEARSHGCAAVAAAAAAAGYFARAAAGHSGEREPAAEGGPVDEGGTWTRTRVRAARAVAAAVAACGWRVMESLTATTHGAAQGQGLGCGPRIVRDVMTRSRVAAYQSDSGPRSRVAAAYLDALGQLDAAH